MTERNFYSIMPLLENEIGHIYAYNLALLKAVEENGWKHVGFVPKNVTIKALPSRWRRDLPSDFWQKKRSFWQKIKSLLLNSFTYRKIFKLAAQNNDIVFLEHFTLMHLFALVSAAFFSRKKPCLWLLHRYLPSKKKKLIFQLIHKLYEVLLGKEKIKLFTDSALLQKDLQKIFKKRVVLLPIPHNHIRIQNVNRSSDLVFLWWPGGIVRKSKGLYETIQISKKVKNSNCRLVLADSMKKHLPCKDHILFIPNELNRGEYEFWMNKVDILLFPYDPIVYSHGTSGVFVEAVSCGKVPFVKEGSWLAHELRRYDLEELIIDWDHPRILDLLVNHLNNSNIRRKLKKMQDDYRLYHSVHSFSKILKAEQSIY